MRLQRGYGFEPVSNRVGAIAEPLEETQGHLLVDVVVLGEEDGERELLGKDRLAVLGGRGRLAPDGRRPEEGYDRLHDRGVLERL